jgi:endonuclease/exonuclease/phosphatase family metal-dependent hydrolase
MKCLTWNLEWASAKSNRIKPIQQKIAEADPDVICYTEVIRTVLPDGYAIEADADYGYSNTGDKRKVILWSKTPWTEVDSFGDPKLPSGRFISGVTGGIRFVGVCISWKDAHVTTGRKDRVPWQDHLLFCVGLENALTRYSSQEQPICILGDYNQRIPRYRQPIRVAQALMKAIPDDFTIATRGMADADGKFLIDHILTSPTLKTEITEIIPRFAEDGTRLSDHVGVVGVIHK